MDIRQHIGSSMKSYCSLLFCLLLSSLAFSQTEENALEAAKLGLIEKLHETMVPVLREELSNRELSEEEAEALIYSSIDTFAACLVLAAQSQAREQGLPEEIILKGIGDRTRGKEESKILLELDTGAMRLKQAPCNDNLTRTTGVQIH